MTESDAALDALVAREKQAMARELAPPPNGLAEVRLAAATAVRWKTLSYVGKAGLIALVIAAGTIGLNSRNERAVQARAGSAPAARVEAPASTATTTAPAAPTALTAPTAPLSNAEAVPTRSVEARATRVATPERVGAPARVDESVPTVAPIPVVAEAPHAPAPSDSLAEELALLRSAQAALRSGDAARALAITAEHASRFPTGALAPERRALERRARCRESAEPRPSDCP